MEMVPRSPSRKRLQPVAHVDWEEDGLLTSWLRGHFLHQRSTFRMIQGPVCGKVEVPIGSRATGALRGEGSWSGLQDGGKTVDRVAWLDGWEWL